VAINLKVEQGTVTAVLRADNPTAAEWIRAHRAELQSSLEGQGLKLDSLEVVVDPDSRRRQPQQERQQDPSRRQRRPATIPHFEVLV
jgi:flagellar hook-length control protein FliK